MRRKIIASILLELTNIGGCMLELSQYLYSIGPLQLVGLLGFLVYMLAFGWVQAGWMDGNSARFSLCNVLAASLVSISLFAEFNMASALIQGSWIIIGIVGLIKRLMHKRSRTYRSCSQEVM